MKLQLWYRSFLLFLTMALAACGGAGEDTSGLTTQISLSSSSNSIQIGTSQYAVLTASLKQSEARPLSGATVTFETNLGSFSASSAVTRKEVKTDGSGQAKIQLYPGSADGKATVTAFAGGYLASQSVAITADSTSTVGKKIGAISLTPTATQITADGSSKVAIDLVTYEAGASGNNTTPLGGVTVTVSTTAGILSSDGQNFPVGQTSLSVTSDANGQARIYLQSTTQTAKATITAESDGVNALSTVSFLPGSPDVNHSSITATPSALPADGSSTSTVTVLLLDANQNIVADGTPVSLQVSDGTITSTNPSTTTLGRASFTYQTPSTPGAVTVSTIEYPGLQTSLTIGSQASPDPSNIEFSVANPHVYVKGVGKNDSTSVVLTVKTAAGDLVKDANSGINNLKVRFKSRPNGGERISGTDASGAVVNSDATGEIAIRTTNGVATVNFQAGTLPGVVELEAEALSATGTSYSPAVVSVIPQISISSGPPKSITLSYPVTNAVTDMGTGVYRRNGTVFVTDRYGNAVPDGTVINLGVLDSVIVSNNSATGFAVNITTNANGNAAIAQGSAVVTDNTNSDFGSATITRNNTTRKLQTNDRVLLLNAQSEDKSRFVSSFTVNTLTTNKAYKNTTSNLTYVVGASELGAQIYGYDETQASPTTVFGQAITKDGRARIFLQYPADQTHILTGCYSDPTIDTRATAAPAGSAQVWVVAESSETGATTVDNRVCFSALADWQLLNDSGVTTIAASSNISFRVIDASLIPLPFVNVSPSVTYETNTGNLVVSAGNCSETGTNRANVNGVCTLHIGVSGGASGDTATVTVSTGGNAPAQTISVSIP